MNQEQIKSAIRWFITTFGAFIAGWGTKKGWDLSWITTEAFIGGLAAVAAFVWSLIARTDKNIVVAATKVEAVKEIAIDDPTLAKAVAQTPAADARIVTSNVTSPGASRR